jgi:hypothetical protein
MLTRSRNPTELIMKIQTIRIHRTRPCRCAVILDPPKVPGPVFEVCPAFLSAMKAYTESPHLATICTMALGAGLGELGIEQKISLQKHSLSEPNLGRMWNHGLSVAKPDDPQSHLPQTDSRSKVRK